MASLTHINRQLLPLVAGVRRLEIEAHRPSSALADEVNPVQWLEMFGLFVSVRELELAGTLVPSMAAALEQSAEGVVGRQVFSALRVIHLRGTPMSRAIEAFIVARKLSGHIVSVHYAREFCDDRFGEQEL
ncbi:hypothetical protein EDB84DRAFT_1438928 [Lactarius hengduanensis]|nr:hypothetical protein EDB84DRAFT_1438928 [Lactarius hengduanensis]